MTLAPHPRRLRQPGPVAATRITARSAPVQATLRLALDPGMRLDEAVIGPLTALGIRDAVLTLLAGPWAELAYCTGIPDPTGHRVATYAAPVEVRDAWIVAGSMTLARDPAGAPLVHAHASFLTADGALRGGHLVPERCRTGTVASRAYVAVVDGFAITQIEDAETNHRILRPLGNEEI